MCRLILTCFFITTSVNAVDFGSTGDLWPIAEQNMLVFIEKKLSDAMKSGEWDKEMEGFKDRVIANSQRPTPVEGLSVSTQYEERFYDPSIKLSEDIKDDKGQIFARAGQIINPLQMIPFTQTLYFIDGDDHRQISWMKNQKPETLQYKIILVKGNIPDVSSELDERIYFDQGGTLSKKFALNTIPVRITSAPSGLRLRIETFPINEKNEEMKE